MKKALVTGVTGQDGSCLFEFLMEKTMRLTAPSAATRLTFASASRIWKGMGAEIKT